MKQHFLVTVELDDAAQVNVPNGYIRDELAAFTGALLDFHTPMKERLFRPLVKVESLDADRLETAVLKHALQEGA